MYLGVLPDPQPFATLLAGDLHPDLSREYVVLGLAVRCESPYVRPVKVLLIPDKPLALLQKLREHVFGEVEEGPFGDVVEGAWLEDVDTRVRQGAYGLLGAWFFLETLDVSLLIDLDHPELRSIVDPPQGYGGQRALLPVKLDQFLYVYVGQRVARDDYEGVVEPVGQTLYAPRRAKQLLFPLQVYGHAVHPGLFAVGFEKRVGQVVDVYVHLLDAVAGKEGEDVLDDRGVNHRGHGLGDLTGQREAPGSLACRQSHRFHRPLPFCKAFIGTLYSFSCTRTLYTGSSPRPSSTNP